MNWKRLFFITLTALILTFGTTMFGHVAFSNVAEIADRAIAQNHDLCQIINRQTEIIKQATKKVTEQQQTIDMYEQRLFKGKSDTAFNLEEALNFIDWCIKSHENYYDPALCNVYTGFPEHHYRVNGEYMKLREYIRIK